MHKIIISGYVCKEVQTMTSGEKTFKTFSVSVSVGSGDRKKTLYYDVVFFNDICEQIVKHIKKGSTVTVIGTPGEPKIYKNKNGEQKVAMKVFGDSLNFTPKNLSPNNVDPKQNIKKTPTPVKKDEDFWY